MILAFAHPGLVVPDLDKAITFYRAMFGFEPITREGWSDNPEMDRAVGLHGSATKGCMMRGHNCFLELWEYSAPAQTAPAPAQLLAHENGLRHLAFYVDDCRMEYRRLLSLGGQPLGEPVGAPGQGSAVYGRDPFGNIIELAEIPSPDEVPTALPGVDRLSNFQG
jgi:catechol 2,3-dioxygenase-like lactoylglutathione lyase family enzyme